MNDGISRMKKFEALFGDLQKETEEEFGTRAEFLGRLTHRLSAGDEAARKELKRAFHQLSGIAGSYGYHNLTKMAHDLELKAELSDTSLIIRLTHLLIEQLCDVSSQKCGSEPNSRTDIRPESSTQIPSTRERNTHYTTPSTPEQRYPKPRILAVDDNPDDRKLLELTLNRLAGFNATIVESAQKGLQLVQQEKYDLVITDATMSEMNGLDLCKAIRSLDSDISEIKVVMLSAASSEDLGWPVGQDGPIAWLRKPFHPKDLVENILRILNYRNF